MSVAHFAVTPLPFSPILSCPLEVPSILHRMARVMGGRNKSASVIEVLSSSEEEEEEIEEPRVGRVSGKRRMKSSSEVCLSGLTA